MKPFFKSKPGGFWVISLVMTVLLIAICLSIVCWDWLKSNADTIRVIALMVGGAIAVILTLWRSMIAERQADTTQRQSETAQLGLLNERYQKGAEMLGSEVLPVRLGGIYALRGLAEEYPHEYHLQIMHLLCAFVRNPTKDERQTESEPPPPDVDAAVEAIALRSKSGIELERLAKFDLDLRGTKLHGLSWERFNNVNLCGAHITSADLSDTRFRHGTNLSRIHGEKVDLSSAYLVGVNLRDTKLSFADLTHARLMNAQLFGTRFHSTILTETDLRDVRGLTQVQLDIARAEKGRPPILEGLLDAETDEPLIWRGKPYVPRRPSDLP